MRRRIAWWLACFAVLVQAQPREDANSLLAKIKSSVLENLHHLPNYTCTETIRREERRRKTGVKALVLETVRLEVAYLEGKELFGWPGAARIDQPSIGKMIDGSVGNGYFGLFSKAIFSTPSAEFVYTGRGSFGKPAIKFDYRVPQAAGAYVLKSSLGEADVGFHGSFWVDEATLDLMRIKVTADDPPLVLGIASTSSVLDFERKTIGGSSFVLPRGAELALADRDGNEDNVRLSFSACHEFVGESVIRFDEPAGEPAAAPVHAAVAAVSLPDDFTVDFDLETPIDWETSAGGDPVQGNLRDGIQLDGRTLVPKGATLRGRIAHVALRGNLYFVELTLASLDFPGGTAGLIGRRNGVSDKNLPLIYRTAKFKLGRGTRLTLHSRLLK